MANETLIFQMDANTRSVIDGLKFKLGYYKDEDIFKAGLGLLKMLTDHSQTGSVFVKPPGSPDASGSIILLEKKD